MAKRKEAEADAPRPTGDPGEPGEPGGDGTALYVRRHLRIGWWSILLFLSLGSTLEMLHGFKVDWYLNVANETRRLMWTLAHAHGVLIGVLHLGFAATVRLLPASRPDWRPASLTLTGAGILLPGGFLLGGIWVYSGDPGRGVLLVPVGAVLLFLAALLTALRATRAQAP